MESILTSIKNLLDITAENKDFDDVLIMHINSVLMILTQCGVGPEEGFAITGDTEYWIDFIEDTTELQAVKSYIFMKVRLMFDITSLGAATIAAYERTIQEYEWRLNIAAEAHKTT